MNNLNEVTVPSASHGTHKHKINVPRIFTQNFYEHIPVYSWKFRQGNKLDIDYNFFNRLNAMPVPSLVTGRTSIRGFYVPMRCIFKGWRDFDQKVPHVFADGTESLISKRRYFVQNRFVQVFIADTNLCSQVPSGSPYDFSVIDTSNVVTWYLFTPFGATVYKIFRALGYKMSWDLSDQEEFDATRVLAYIRIFLDHYFPKQYVGNSIYNRFMGLCEYDMSGSTEVNPVDLLDGIGHFVFGYYNDSVFDVVWDSPSSPNTFNQVGDITIMDPTNNANKGPMGVSNSNSYPHSPHANEKPTNGTAFIGGNDTASTNSPMGVVTKFVLDSLSSLANFLRRHQLGGSRAIENFLLERGYALDKADQNISYKLDSYSIPFEVSAVESNSDLALDTAGVLTNKALGELAGKASNSSEGMRLRFRDTFDCDGVFMIFQVALPDNDQVCAIDPTNLEITAFDSLHPTFDKLGTALVRSRILFQDNNGQNNRVLNSQDFGFLDRYYQEAIDVPLVFGDFDVISRGSQTLHQYHTLRQLWTYIANNSWYLSHSYDFLRVGRDHGQYSRLFYTDKEDNMKTVVRIRGRRWTQKLPLGQSYDWEDDEFNKQVTVLQSGNVE